MNAFIGWMNRRHCGFLYTLPYCWNWKVSGVLVTLWMQTGLLKIYHDEGRQTECHPVETERCREAVHAIADGEIERRWL